MPGEQAVNTNSVSAYQSRRLALQLSRAAETPPTQLNLNWSPGKCQRPNSPEGWDEGIQSLKGKKEFMW